jgi:hypothetical protein
MTSKPVLPKSMMPVQRPITGPAKLRALDLLTDRTRLERLRCAMAITESAERAIEIRTLADLDARAREIRLSYEPTGPCRDCGAPPGWRHWLGCPEDLTEKENDRADR